MALREHGRLLRLTAAQGGTLTAPNHESFRILGIFCNPSTNDTYLTLIIAGTTVGKFRVAGLAGNHLPYPAVKTTQLYELTTGGLLTWLALHGIPLSFPLAAGQTFTVSRYNEAGDVTLLYDAYDAGDVAASEPNGSAATVRTYLHYLTNAAAITESPASLDKSLIWSGMDPWPVAARQVGAGQRLEVLAILGCPVAHGTGAANAGYTTHLRLIRDGDVLMDDAQEGIPFLGDAAQTADAALYDPKGSLIGPVTAERPYPGLVLTEPLAFAPGGTLTPEVLVGAAGAGGIAADEMDVALVLRRTVGA